MLHTKLEDNYGPEVLDYETKRYTSLHNSFPIGSENVRFYVRSPGRVNIISEHTDYSHFNVLPAALTQDFVYAIGYNSNDMITSGEASVMKIHISHELSKEYQSDEVDFDLTLQTEPVTVHRFNENFRWSSYVRAGIHAAFVVLSSNAKNLGYSLRESDYMKFPKNLYIHGHGDIPLGSGLSSSSALSCASALAIAATFYELSQKPVNHDEVMYNLAVQDPKSERLVGLEGGAMDQTISLLGKRGNLLEISFVPTLSVKEVQLPQSIKIAVFSSLVDSKKASGAKTFYNTRVAECRMGFAILLKKAGISFEKGGSVIDEDGNYRNIMGKDVLKLLNIEKTPMKAVSLIESVYKIPEKMTLEGICKELEIEPINGLKSYLGMTIKGHYLIPLEPENKTDEYTIAPRMRHVFTEAYRVGAFIKNLGNLSSLLKEENPEEEYVDMLKLSIGELLNDSHRSLKGDYECSCKELDDVVRISNEKGGALGSRLTGAGLGGYAVALVDTSAANEYIEVMNSYYLNNCEVKKEDLSKVCFLTEPANGASIVDFCPTN